MRTELHSRTAELEELAMRRQAEFEGLPSPEHQLVVHGLRLEDTPGVCAQFSALSSGFPLCHII